MDGWNLWRREYSLTIIRHTSPRLVVPTDSPMTPRNHHPSEGPMHSRYPTRLFVLSFLLIPSLVEAQWLADGVPLTKAANTQTNVAVSAGYGNGLFSVWEDSRNAGTGVDIYAQR